jgi:hypothetical protein
VIKYMDYTLESYKVSCINLTLLKMKLFCNIIKNISNFMDISSFFFSFQNSSFVFLNDTIILFSQNH